MVLSLAVIVLGFYFIGSSSELTMIGLSFAAIAILWELGEYIYGLRHG
jgi:hypothetical protein